MNRNTDFIPFARPVLGEREIDAAVRVMKSGWLTTGAQALAFEREFAAFCGARHALAVNSATAGLHLSLDALDLEPGSLVLTTPYTFAASAEVVRYVGCDPFFVDIDRHTYNLDPRLVERSLERRAGRIRAVLPVHVGGMPCDMSTIGRLCRAAAIPLVEDAAHAFPVRTRRGFVGTLGDTGVFSFYANKTITTGEGGMIVTGRDDLARRMKLMRLHGIDRDSWDRYTSRTASWEYYVVEAGYKYNMSDLAAAIGRVQLQRADEFLRRRRDVARRYLQGLGDCDFLELPRYQKEHAWHLFMIRLVPERLKISRDEFIGRLAEAGIGVSVHYRPLHLMPYYQKRYGLRPEDFPVSLRNFLTTISLPIYPSLGREQVARIVETVRQIGYTAVKARSIPTGG